MIEPASDDRLSQLMQELGPADPPAGLRRQVMARVGQQQATERIIPFKKRGIAMTKKAMIGLAAAAAVALGVFAVKGFPPVGRGTEGTIGAAKKYQAPQMDSKDVVLGDAAAQEFLQSEVFDRIMKDPEARNLLSDADVQTALKRDVIAHAIADDRIRGTLASADLARILADKDLKVALTDSYRTDAAGAAIKQATAQAAAHSAMQANVARIRGNVDLARVLNDNALRDELFDSNLYQGLARGGNLAALNNRAFVAGVSSRGFRPALVSGRLGAALAPK